MGWHEGGEYVTSANSKLLGICLFAPILLAAASTPAVRPDIAPLVNVYLDSSGTMAGYVRSQFEEKPIGDLLTLFNNGIGLPKRSTVKWRCFGDLIAEIPGELDAFSRADAYSSPNASPCGNQTSRIDKVLAEVRKQPVTTLNLIVSDLWLDGNEMAAAPAVALGIPLKSMLEQGRAVAILGVESPFLGRITGVPGLGGGTYAAATKRPLFIVAIGPEGAVAQLVEDLRRSGAPSLSGKRLNVALFRGRGAPRLVQLPTVRGGGISGKPGAYQTNKQLLAEQQGRLERTISGRERLLDGTVWQGPLTGIALVQIQNKQGGWSLWPNPLPVWYNSNSKDKLSLQFRLDARSVKGLPSGTYRVTALSGNKGLKRPNPATKWLRDWSLSPTEKPEPQLAKALQLANLADMLEAADDQLARQVPFGKNEQILLPFRPNQMFQFTLKVKE